MSKQKLIEQINIKEPCSESWDEMDGNDEVRFCGHCNLNVNNLSAMTRRKALKIVKKANGRICVRYMQNPVDKKPVFGDKIYQITRRAGIAAGVLGASLTLSTLAYAQGGTMTFSVNDSEVQIVTSQKNSDADKTESPTAEISGTVTDSGGGFAYNISVNLIDLDTEESLEAKTDNDGFYKFQNVREGNYKIVIADEKGNAEVSFLEINAASETLQDIALTIPTIIEETVEEESVYYGSAVGGAIAIEISYENPLSMAVWNDDQETAKNLIARGADVNGKEKNHENITPLFLAVNNGNYKIAEMLLNFGADVNALDESGKTPLMRIDDDANAEFVRLFIKHGAKINAVDNAGNTALILAAEDADADVLQALLDGGADVNIRNKEGRTALMEAAYDDNLANVKTLILGDADVNLKDNEGETALDLTSDKDVESFLKSYGAIGKVE